MATHTLEIVPFDVPSFVTLKFPPARRDDGLRQPVLIALQDLDDATLGALIEEFAAGVLKAAGRGAGEG